jgi:hypothetical protein
VLSVKQKNQLMLKYKNLVWVENTQSTWIFVDTLQQNRLAGIEEINDFSIVDKRCNFGKEEAYLIKQNPVRQVFQGEEFFYKRTYKDDGNLLLEFKRTIELNNLGIPCVKCVALGFTAHGVVLVTQAQKGTFQLDKYLEKHPFDSKMKSSFQEFILNLLARQVAHDDFHLGNILYHPIENKFYLVDVLKCKVIKTSWFYRIFAQPKIVRIFCLLRDKLQFSIVEEMLLACKITTPKIFYKSQIACEVKRIVKEWPKRKRQVLSGYEKFTRKEGDFLWLAIAKDSDCQNAQVVFGNASYLLADIFLGLMRIPHRRVLKVDLASNKVWLEEVNNSNKVNLEVMVEYQQRLEDILQVKTSQEDWSNSDIYPVIFTGYEKIVNLLLFSLK